MPDLPLVFLNLPFSNCSFSFADLKILPHEIGVQVIQSFIFLHRDFF